MVAEPSLPETLSRAAPVALFTTDTFASFTTAPDWSTTETIIDAVLGDCATTTPMERMTASENAGGRDITCCRAHSMKNELRIGSAGETSQVTGERSVLPDVVGSSRLR